MQVEKRSRVAPISYYFWLCFCILIQLNGETFFMYYNIKLIYMFKASRRFYLFKFCQASRMTYSLQADVILSLLLSSNILFQIWYLFYLKIYNVEMSYLSSYYINTNLCCQVPWCGGKSEANQQQRIEVVT